MGEIEIPAGEKVKVLSDDQAGHDWKFQLRGAKVLADHSRSDIETVGSRIEPGDRGKFRDLNGERLWVYNDDTSTAYLDLSPTSFSIDFGPRVVVGGVQTSSRSDVAPASDDFIHRYDTGVDCNAATVTESFVCPDRADFVVVSVDDGDGAYHVEVEFLDGEGGSEVTHRDDNNSTAYAGTPSSDVFQRVAVASPYVNVKIIDDSGAANTVDYSIYAR